MREVTVKDLCFIFGYVAAGHNLDKEASAFVTNLEALEEFCQLLNDPDIVENLRAVSQKIAADHPGHEFEMFEILEKAFKK